MWATPLLTVFPFPGFTSSPRPLLETHKSPLALHSSFPPSIHLSLLSSCLEAASLTHIKQLGSRRSRSRPLFSPLPPQHFPAPVLNVHRTHVYTVRARRESASPSPVKTHFQLSTDVSVSSSERRRTQTRLAPEY